MLITMLYLCHAVKAAYADAFVCFSLSMYIVLCIFTLGRIMSAHYIVYSHLQLTVSCSPLIKRLLAREKTAGYLFWDLLVKGQCGLKKWRAHRVTIPSGSLSRIQTQKGFHAGLSWSGPVVFSLATSSYSSSFLSSTQILVLPCTPHTDGMFQNFPVLSVSMWTALWEQRDISHLPEGCFALL